MNYGSSKPLQSTTQPYVVCGPPRSQSGSPWPHDMSHTHDIQITIPTPPPDPNYTYMDKLWMRTGWSNREAPFYSFYMVVPPNGDKVLLWIANRDGTHVVLEDDKALFPSDPLVTQLLMLKE